MTLVLKAPARPRSPVTRTTPTRSTFSCSSSTGTRGRPPACSAARRVSLRIPSAYGRMAAIRCSERRSRAAATISIARVILLMFLIDAMRFLTSFWLAMAERRAS